MALWEARNIERNQTDESFIFTAIKYLGESNKAEPSRIQNLKIFILWTYLRVFLSFFKNFNTITQVVCICDIVLSLNILVTKSRFRGTPITQIRHINVHWTCPTEIFLILRFFSLFRFLPKVFFLEISKMKNFNGTGGYIGTGVPLKFFTCPTEIFGFSWIQYKIRLRKRTKYPEYASRIFGEATSLFLE